MVNDSLRNSLTVFEKRSYQIPVFRGPMGVGKTTAAHYVAMNCSVPEERTGVIRLYFSLESIKFSWSQDESESMTVLAQVLVAALVQDKKSKSLWCYQFPRCNGSC